MAGGSAPTVHVNDVRSLGLSWVSERLRRSAAPFIRIPKQATAPFVAGRMQLPMDHPLTQLLVSVLQNAEAEAKKILGDIGHGERSRF